MTHPFEATIHVEEIGPEQFSLTVTFDGDRFECGNYINRFAAMKAGKLFVERKEGEQAGRKKRSPKRNL